MSKRKNIDRSGYLGGYPKKMPDGRLALTDGHGNVLGYGKVVGTSKIRPGAPGHWISSERVSYNFTVAGRHYHGRGFGEGMALTLRPMKSR